jgi:hypothetical protein
MSFLSMPQLPNATSGALESPQGLGLVPMVIEQSGRGARSTFIRAC